jgi:elongation factor Ts
VSFTAKDVQALRQATGAGMMDAKRALEATDGDMEAARQWLREKGLGDVAKRQERESAQGAVSLFVDGSQAGLVKLTSETDFVASSETFRKLADDLAALVAHNGPDAAGQRAKEIDDLKITLKENIQLADVVQFEAATGNLLDSYLHVQGGRGVNGVLVELAGGTAELAHGIAVHIAFGRPVYLAPEDVPAEVVEKERATLETVTRNEGKPEQAIAKIVEGRLQGFYKTVCLLEQPYAKDDKKQVKELLDGATVVRWAQAEIG